MMGLGLQPGKFARGFIKLQARRRIQALVTGLGPERIERLIIDKTPLSSLLPPDKLQEYRALAARNSWLADVISDEEFLQMLPPWVLDLVKKHGDPGREWLIAELTWIRALFRG
jgi:hypothetical protein